MNKSMGLILFITVAIAAFSYQLSNKDSELPRAPKGGDFVLQSHDGEFDLKDYRGKVGLVYFGYTFCPDVCPTSLASMSQVLNEMSEQEMAQVFGLFVSVDPERDTLAQLKIYTQHFHKKILGATGNAETIKEIATRYGSAYVKVEESSKAGYLIDHTSFIYLVSPDGALAHAFPHGTDPADILTKTREYTIKSTH